MRSHLLLRSPGSGACRRLTAVLLAGAVSLAGAASLVGALSLAGAGMPERVAATGDDPQSRDSAPPRPVLVDVTADDRAEDAEWVWPTGMGVVVRPWEAPEHDYAAGHRGIDVAARLGTLAVAVDSGTVAFAGSVGGRGVVTIDHGAGLVSTLDSVEPLVRAGESVAKGDGVGRVAVGHCPAAAGCLHIGARVDDRYIDPRPYLPSARWPVLLPEDAWPG